MLNDTEEIKVRQICLHLIRCKGGRCHGKDGVAKRRQSAMLVLDVLDGVNRE